MSFPVTLTINIIFKSIKLLGYFPTTAGISTTISPREIVTGETLNYKRHLAILFGKYCQIHEEYTPHNSKMPCTRGDICIDPRGNKQGGFNFMSLGSIKNVERRSWDAIPMPDTVIARVNTLG